MFLIILFYILFYVIFLLSPRWNTVEKRYDKQFWFVFILLFIFWGLRDLPILNDTNHYYLAQLLLLNSPSFANCTYYFIDPDSIWQPGFQIVQCLIGKLWNDPYALIMISALVVISFTLWFIKQYTNQYALIVFFMLSFGILGGQISAMRQGWAMCVFYVACYYIEKKKIVITILLILLAMQFHSSAYVLFLLLGLNYLSFSKKHFFWIMLGGITFLILLSPILQMLDYGDSKYIETAAEREGIAVAALLILAMQLILLAVIYYQTKKYNIAKPSSLILWGTVLSLIFNMAAIPIQVFNRFTVYFGIFQFLLLIHCLKYVHNSRRIIILSFFMFLSLAKTAIVIEYRNEWSHMVPYSFFDFSVGPQIKDFGY